MFSHGHALIDILNNPERVGVECLSDILINNMKLRNRLEELTMTKRSTETLQTQEATSKETPQEQLQPNTGAGDTGSDARQPRPQSRRLQRDAANAADHLSFKTEGGENDDEWN